MRELFSGRNGRVATGLLVAEFVAATQGLVTAAIMPRIVSDLHGLGAYSLAFGGFFGALILAMPFAGPWSDKYGARTMLAVSLSVLAAGMTLVAIAPTMPAFIAARFIQGAGDGLDYAVTFAIVGKAFDGPLRARMMSLTASMWVVPALVGPGLGAYVAVTFGWRWAFAGFLPLIALAALLLLPVIANHRSQAVADPFAAVKLLFSRATLQARDSAHAIFVAFALISAAFFGADAYIALMLTSVRGMSLQLASINLTLAVLGWSATALAAPGLVARVGLPRVVGWGAAGCAAGCAGYIAVGAGIPVLFSFAAALIAGSGIGLAYPTLTAAGFGTESEHEGSVSSATLLAGVLGMMLGVLACGVPVAFAAHGSWPLSNALIATFGISGSFGVALVWLSRRLDKLGVTGASSRDAAGASTRDAAGASTHDAAEG